MNSLNSDSKMKYSKYGSFDISTEVAKDNQRCRIKWLIALQFIIIGLILFMLAAFCLVAYPRFKDKSHKNAEDHDAMISKRNIATLYALDPLAHSFCFRDGGYGEKIDNGSIYNRCSDMEFESYTNGSFSVAVEGAVTGVIIDLGSSETLQKKYRYQEIVGNGQGFASIHRKHSTLLIAKNNAYDHQYQPMPEESAALFGQGQALASAPVRLGHMYVLRLVDPTREHSERIVKFVVISYRPHESVTFRWESIN